MSKLNPWLTNGRQSDQSIFETASAAPGQTAAHLPGTRGVLEDGRVFHYARNSGAAIVAGQLLQTPDLSAQNQDLAAGTEILGSTTITVTLGSVAATAQDFAGGYVVTNSGTTAAGLTLPIASHPAAAGTASLVLTLDGPNPVLFNADTTVTLVKSPWADVIISGTNQDHLACGVSPTPVVIGSTTAQYFWCQTWGLAGVWQDDTTANGSALASGSTAGQVEIAGADGDQVVGLLMEAGIAADYSPTLLTIAP